MAPQLDAAHLLIKTLLRRVLETRLKTQQFEMPTSVFIDTVLYFRGPY